MTRSDHDPETGPPIAELRDLEEPVRPGFRARVRRRIERRQLAGQAFDLGWAGIFEVVRAWLDAVFAVLQPNAERRSPKDGQPPGPASKGDDR